MSFSHPENLLQCCDVAFGFRAIIRSGAKGCYEIREKMQALTVFSSWKLLRFQFSVLRIIDIARSAIAGQRKEAEVPGELPVPANDG